MRTNSFAWPLIALLLGSPGCQASAVNSQQPGEAEAQVNGDVHPAGEVLAAAAVQVTEPETVTAADKTADDESADDESADDESADNAICG